MKTANIRRLAALAVLALAVAAVWTLRGELGADQIEEQVRALGWLGPLAFIGAYIVAAPLFLPGSMLTVAGGALFGPLWGTMYTLVGATAGAGIAFLVARYLASEWVAEKVRGRAKTLIDGVEAEGWRFVAVTRLLPIIPFNLLNYALGLTRVPLGQYLVTSFVCMAPGAFAYTWLGFAGREALAGNKNTVFLGLLALGLLATVALLPTMIRRWRARPANPGI